MAILAARRHYCVNDRVLKRVKHGGPRGGKRYRKKKKKKKKKKGKERKREREREKKISI